MKSKRWLYIFVLVLFLITASLSYRIYDNILKTREMKLKLAESNAKYEKLKEEKEKIQKELEDAREGINKEKFVRDKLNLKKEGETIYKIVDEETGTVQKEEGNAVTTSKTEEKGE